jgi:hypothetical protein
VAVVPILTGSLPELYFDGGRMKKHEGIAAVSGLKNAYLQICHHGLFSYVCDSRFLDFQLFFLSFVSCELLTETDTDEKKKSKKMLRNLLDDAPENSP